MQNSGTQNKINKYLTNFLESENTSDAVFDTEMSSIDEYITKYNKIKIIIEKCEVREVNEGICSRKSDNVGRYR